MKKIIALLLCASILFCFTACNNTSTDFLDEPVELNVEMLRENWDKGEITFANGESITLPCTREELQVKSTLFLYNTDDVMYSNISAKSSVDWYLADKDTKILATYANFEEKKDIKFLDSTVIGVKIEDIKEGNRQVKFAGTLTTGVARTDVEKALGIPEGASAESDAYTYNGEKIILTITFNEKDVASTVEYKVITK